jgi:hypothetical protein
MAAVARTLIGLAVAFAALAAVVVAGIWWVTSRPASAPAPGAQRCVATAGDNAVALDLDQAHYTSIIAGLSVRRGLAARAATIAMATVYQETDIRNLDYGDRDSVGLFQQRPSQGWGTVRQIMDPYYSTGKFYDALVKVRDWRTGEITEVAQKVQISAFPDAYADHETDARVLASVFTGNSPGGLSCLERTGATGDLDGLAAGLRKTVGRPDIDTGDHTLSLKADSAKQAWAYAAFAVANSGRYGVTAVTVGDRVLEIDGTQLAAWGATDDAVGKDEVRITVR